MRGGVQLRVLGDKDDWTPGEDALLAAGLRRFGTQVEQIRTYLLPARSVKIIRARMRLRTKAAANSNCIKASLCSCSQDLCPGLMPWLLFSLLPCRMAAAVGNSLSNNALCQSIQQDLVSKHSVGSCQTIPSCNTSVLNYRCCFATRRLTACHAGACRRLRRLCWDRCLRRSWLRLTMASATTAMPPRSGM